MSCLPADAVQDGESITDALVSEVAEEIGLDVVPERLLYVAEVVGSYGAYDLNLVWLSEPEDPVGVIDDDALVAFDSPLAQSIMPPIVEQIAAEANSGWPEEPRWLGNVRRSARR